MRIFLICISFLIVQQCLPHDFVFGEYLFFNFQSNSKVVVELRPDSSFKLITQRTIIEGNILLFDDSVLLIVDESVYKVLIKKNNALLWNSTVLQKRKGYNGNGDIIESYELRFDNEDSTYIKQGKYYYDDGLVMVKGKYKDNSKHGKWYYSSPFSKSKIKYKNGKIEKIFYIRRITPNNRFDILEKWIDSGD